MELPREWEAIVNQHQCGSGCYTVQYAVERCYALHCKPQRELTDAEISRIWDDGWDSPIHYAKLVIAAHQRKQTEPEKVKFRAARIKKDASGEPIMLHAELVFDENSPYEWLDIDGKPQEYEVTLP